VRDLFEQAVACFDAFVPEMLHCHFSPLALRLRLHFFPSNGRDVPARFIPSLSHTATNAI
jgi:hypothetical protein